PRQGMWWSPARRKTGPVRSRCCTSPALSTPRSTGQCARFRWDRRTRCGIRGQIQEAGHDMKPSRDISGLIEVMAALRTPVTGCPWDLEQNFASIAPYTIEEAYEVAEAISRGDLDDLKDELGDLLLQVVYHARMAEEQNAFAFGDVVEAVTRKMIRRHPHVFGDENGIVTAGHVSEFWDRIKAEEKAERAARRPPEEAS